MKRILSILLALVLLLPVTALAAEGETCANGHSYGAWVDLDETQHSRTCTLCGHTDTVRHRWDSSYISVQASCKEPGVRVHSCSLCGATKETELPKWDAHTYSYKCDATCNICGVRRYTTHGDSTNWFSNETIHWRECTICAARLEEEAHTAGDSCRLCGYQAPTQPTEAPTEAVTQPTEAPTEAETQPTVTTTQPTAVPVETRPAGSGVLLWVILIVVAFAAIATLSVVLYKKKGK